MITLDTPGQIADRFADILRTWIGAARFQIVRERNADAGGINCPECHSHDFCDANMAMQDAFENVLGRSPAIDTDGQTVWPDREVEADCDLWNVAWDIAKVRHLTGYENPRS